MAPRGRKKVVSVSPQKQQQRTIKEFFSPPKSQRSPQKRKRNENDEAENDVIKTKAAKVPLSSPRKKAHRGVESATNNNNNNNNNDKEVEVTSNNNNNNNNNNNEKTVVLEKKSRGKAGSSDKKSKVGSKRQKRGTKAQRKVMENESDPEVDIMSVEEEEANDNDSSVNAGKRKSPPTGKHRGDKQMEEESKGDDDDDGEDTATVPASPAPTTSQNGSDNGDSPSSVVSAGRILQTPPTTPKDPTHSIQCKGCDKWFPNRYYQRKHMLMEHENQLYECRICNFHSVNPEKLKSHIIKQHVIKKERTEPISLDELKVDLDELIAKHTPRKVMMEDGVALGRDASSKMRYICAMCDRIYTSKYSLERHVRCHTGEKPYVCDVCSFSTSYREHMVRHMTSVHLIVHSDEPKQKYIPKNRRKTVEKNVSTEDPEMVDLADGDETTRPQGKKRRNILRKRFECAACGMKATHKTDLVNHIREKHPNAHIESLDNGDGSKVHLIVTVSKKPTASRRMVITCPDCSKVFHDTWKYKVHMRSHTGVKPFGCSFCEFYATSKMTIRDHIHRKHKNEENPRILLRTMGLDGKVSHVELNVPHREFKCDICDETFTDNYHMKHHKKKMHTEQAPFSCTECNHREWARATIVIHCLQAHKDKSLEGMILRNNKPISVGPLKLPQCQQCDKVFPYQSQLYIHMKQHTGERNYQCDMCNYRTNSKPALEKHVMKHLEEEQQPKKAPTSRKRSIRKKGKEDVTKPAKDADDPAPVVASDENEGDLEIVTDQ